MSERALCQPGFGAGAAGGRWLRPGVLVSGPGWSVAGGRAAVQPGGLSTVRLAVPGRPACLKTVGLAVEDEMEQGAFRYFLDY